MRNRRNMLIRNAKTRASFSRGEGDELLVDDADTDVIDKNILPGQAEIDGQPVLWGHLKFTLGRVEAGRLFENR